MSVAQEHVALLMEVAYLALKDHPAVAKEVRLSANMSRTQHMMTLGLMKTYVVTSSTILKTMIPLIKTAVKLKKSVILKPMFLKVLKFSEEMRDEALKTRASYYQLQDKIQRDTADVNTANVETTKRQHELQEELKKEEERKKIAEEHFKKLHDDREKKEQEINKMKAERDELLKRAVPSGQKTDASKDFLSGVMNPQILDADPTGAKTAIKGFFGVLGSVISTVKETIEGNRALKASERVHEFMQREVEETHHLQESMDKAEKEAFEAKHRLNALAVDKAFLGDLESLIEASEQLAKIDGQLVNIISFWDNLAAFIKSMNQKGEAGECFLEAIEDETCAEMFNQELEGVEQGWEHFGCICRTYVDRATVTVPKVYGFLSEPIDKLSIEERKSRSRQLIQELRSGPGRKAIDFGKQ